MACRVCGGVGHNARTCPQKQAVAAVAAAPAAAEEQLHAAAASDQSGAAAAADEQLLAQYLGERGVADVDGLLPALLEVCSSVADAAAMDAGDVEQLLAPLQLKRMAHKRVATALLAAAPSSPSPRPSPPPAQSSPHPHDSDQKAPRAKEGGRQLAPPAGFEFFGFLTHSWVPDCLGRETHARVSRINDGLKARGMATWFDGDKMQDDVVDKMISGIDDSAVIVVLITEAYVHKVGSGNNADNCRKEFSYANRQKTSARMIPVPMEPAVANPNAWTGPVGMELGGLLYKASFAAEGIDDDDAEFEKNIDALFAEILRVCGRTDEGEEEEADAVDGVARMLSGLDVNEPDEKQGREDEEEHDAKERREGERDDGEAAVVGKISGRRVQLSSGKSYQLYRREDGSAYYNADGRQKKLRSNQKVVDKSGEPAPL